jgi:hypothetical protein
MKLLTNPSLWIPWATLADHPGPKRISTQTRDRIRLSRRSITLRHPRPLERHPLPRTPITGLVQKTNPFGHPALIGFLHHLPYKDCNRGRGASKRSGPNRPSCPRGCQSRRPPHPAPLPEALPLTGEDVEAAGLRPIRIIITDRAGIGILIAMPRAGLPGIPRQRLPRQPHPRPGVIQPNAKFIQAQVLIPFFARKGVMVVRVRPVALRRDETAVSIIIVASPASWPGASSGSKLINPVDKS